ncbi:TDT family transporter [Leekyejoonella antrihumi]|uniref:TDT family transporter n=1 Tax=Leekyejoonella antrihumi TaxID=1660198 RepID=A0A563E721_9MICO|nr:TDT family transporter [Leekyejoonella antrihumi]TWP38320.1 TDT family transporter [Leekyejoonella antrihumi]
MKRTAKIPLNFFGIPFGLAGLGEAWSVLADFHHAPAAIGEVILLVAAAAWVIVGAAYLAYLGTAKSTLAAFTADLLDPSAGPLASLALITPMLLAALGLYPHAPGTGRVITDLFLILTVLLGAWFTGQWIYYPLDLDRIHPGYFLPTVAGGLIAADGAAIVGQHRLAEAMFGLGVLCWIVLGSLILGRLLFRPMLPAALQPTLAIEVAPAAVAGLAWFDIQGHRLDVVMALLAGYGLLMVLAQLRLLPVYRRLTFTSGTWSFTFSWAAVDAIGIVWLQSTQPVGYRIWQYLLIAAVTVLIGGIGARTVRAILRGQLLPAQPSTPATPPVRALPHTPSTTDAR